MHRLKDLDLGRLDAESDENLLRYFLDTGTVEAIRSGRKLVIGRKGSGKTALFTYLSNLESTRTVQLDLDQYVWEFHRGFREVGLSDEQAYSASWKLVIYTSAYALIRDGIPPADRSKGDAAIADLGVGSDRGRIAAILNWLSRVRKLKLPAVTGVAQGGSIEVDKEGETPLSAATANGIAALESVLQQNYADSPFIVLIDRLDDGWDGSEESLHLIAGAIRATRDVGTRFRSRGFAPVITFLRSDLWERLSFNDRNKMSQDIEFLEWSSQQLIDVIDLRIAESYGIQAADAWKAVFTQDEMRQRARSQTYITKRTLGRPRDIVAFSIFCRDKALEREHDIIDAQDIYDAERRYSRHIFDEFKDEMDRHVVDFPAVTNALKALRTRTFQYDDWLRAASENGLTKRPAVEALDALVEASIIGMHTTGGSSGGSGTVFRYEDRHLKPREDGTLQVHLALVRELGLKDA